MNWRSDKGLLLVILFLLGFGLVQVFSTSYIFATETSGDGLLFFRRQVLFTLLALVILFSTASLSMDFWHRWGLLIWAVAFLGVALTFVPNLSITAGGAHRWLRMPFGQRFEPAELLKVGMILLVAGFVANKHKAFGRWNAWLRALLVGVPLILLLKQPDFGSFVIVGSVVFGLLFAFGLKWRYILSAIALAVPGIYFLIISSPYRYARIQAFLNPWADPEEKGFQVIQSMLSFHAGGFFGKGLGLGQGKLFFLPEAHNDFTLAVLGEELGFMGISFVLLLYGFVVFRGLQIAIHSKSEFGKAVALGVTILLGLTVFINVGVVMGFLPTKGLTLPFLSYGGSSLVCTAFAMGLLLSVDRENQQPRRKRFTGYRI